MTLVGVVIHVTYDPMGRTNTTVIPCIESMWYKFLTVYLFAVDLFYIVVKILETRKLADGSITMYPEFVCKANATCVSLLHEDLEIVFSSAKF